MNEESIRRSKVYTYFYGKNRVFQQFLIVVGILLIMLTPVAIQASVESNQKKQDKLLESYKKAAEAYEDVYFEYGNLFNVDWQEYISASRGDDDYKQKREYNEALKEYEKAQEKLEKFYEKDKSKTFFGELSKILGILSISAGVLWIILKKLMFNKDGETEYDEELRYRIEEAKIKGLEKLNIISDQIERVEPVVLNGVAYVEETDNILSKSLFKGVLGKVLRGFIFWNILIVGFVLAVVFVFLASFIVKNMVVFVLVFLVVLSASGVAGYFIYKKFELESYVSPKSIKKLANLPPNFISKLGSDDVVRVSLPAITVYMFGDDQLYMYYQYLDIVTGRIFCEGVYEYFYEDIVGITSKQETNKIFKRCGFMKLFLKSVDYLRESITVVSSGCTHKESYIVEIGNSLLDTQFIGMRNLIRQKKAEK